MASSMNDSENDSMNDSMNDSIEQPRIIWMEQMAIYIPTDQLADRESGPRIDLCQFLSPDDKSSLFSDDSSASVLHIRVLLILDASGRMYCVPTSILSAYDIKLNNFNSDNIKEIDLFHSESFPGYKSNSLTIEGILESNLEDKSPNKSQNSNDIIQNKKVSMLKWTWCLDQWRKDSKITLNKNSSRKRKRSDQKDKKKMTLKNSEILLVKSFNFQVIKQCDDNEISDSQKRNKYLYYEKKSKKLFKLPKKVILSRDHQYMMIFGVLSENDIDKPFGNLSRRNKNGKGVASFAVYKCVWRIEPNNTKKDSKDESELNSFFTFVKDDLEFSMKLDFQLIYSDACSTVIDACFTSDSNGIALIPRVSKNSVHLFALDSLRNSDYSNSNTNPGTFKWDMLMANRAIGPFVLLSSDSNNQNMIKSGYNHIEIVEMSHSSIEGSLLHIITWSESGHYCIWQIENRWYHSNCGTISYFDEKKGVDKNFIKSIGGSNVPVLYNKIQRVLKKDDLKKNEELLLLGLAAHCSDDGSRIKTCLAVSVRDKNRKEKKSDGKTKIAFIAESIEMSRYFKTVDIISTENTLKVSKEFCTEISFDSSMQPLLMASSFKLSWEYFFLPITGFLTYIPYLEIYNVGKYEFAEYAFGEIICVETQSVKDKNIGVSINSPNSCERITGYSMENITIDSMFMGVSPWIWEKFSRNSSVLMDGIHTLKIGSCKLMEPLDDPIYSDLIEKKKTETDPDDSDISYLYPAQSVIGLHLPTCLHCCRPIARVFLCSKCRNAIYCSRECQLDGWKNKHSLQCSVNSNDLNLSGRKE